AGQLITSKRVSRGNRISGGVDQPCGGKPFQGRVAPVVQGHLFDQLSRNGGGEEEQHGDGKSDEYRVRLAATLERAVVVCRGRTIDAGLRDAIDATKGKAKRSSASAATTVACRSGDV